MRRLHRSSKPTLYQSSTAWPAPAHQIQGIVRAGRSTWRIEGRGDRPTAWVPQPSRMPVAGRVSGRPIPPSFDAAGAGISGPPSDETMRMPSPKSAHQVGQTHVDRKVAQDLGAHS